MAVETVFQTAVFLALNGNITANVYDTAPQAADSGDDSVFPYITIGEVVCTDDPVDEADGFSVLMRVHTFTRTGSMLDCKLVQTEVHALLHNQSLSVTGFNCYSLLRERSEVFDGQDGNARGVCEYRALLEAV